MSLREYFHGPMASGGGLTDLILRFLGFVFGVVPLEKNVLAVLNNSAGKDQKKKVELSSQRFAIGVFCPASGRV